MLSLGLVEITSPREREWEIYLPFSGIHSLLTRLTLHGNSVPVYQRDLVPLRREKLASPANARELCSRVYAETRSPQARKCA